MKFAKGAVVGALIATVSLVAATAYAGTGIGGVFNLGQSNSVNSTTTLTGGAAGPQLNVKNTSTASSATGIQIATAAGRPPLVVNSAAQVLNLNASLLGGLSSTAFLPVAGTATNSSKLGGLASTTYQQRVSGACAVGLAITSIAANGAVQCAPASGANDVGHIATLDWYGANYAGGSYAFNGPVWATFDGAHIWVPNWSGNSVTELNASDGSWVRTVSGGGYGFNNPDWAAFDGTHIWVSNVSGNSVTELNASDGSLVQLLSGGSYGFDLPQATAFDGMHVWIPNYGGNSVTEINASDGSWVRTFSGGTYGFSHPLGVAFDGTHMWVPNFTGNSMTQLPAG